MKNSINLDGTKVLGGEAKRKSKIYANGKEFKEFQLTEESKTFINLKLTKGKFTKESKEGKAVLVSLVQQGAIGESNAISGKQVIKGLEAINNDGQKITNDANKTTRSLRLLNNTEANANRNTESWAKGSTIPQSNYFNLEYCYPKVKIGIVNQGTSKQAKLDALYYLEKPIDLASLKVRGLITKTK